MARWNHAQAAQEELAAAAEARREVLVLSSVLVGINARWTWTWFITGC